MDYVTPARGRRCRNELFSQAIQRLSSADVDSAVGGYRRGQGLVVESILGQSLEVRRGGHDRCDALGVEEIDALVGGQGRGPIAALEAFFPLRPTGERVEAAGRAVVGDQEQELAPDDRRGTIGRVPVGLPDDILSRAFPLATGPHRQERLPHALRGVDHLLRGHGAGDRATADQVGQIPQPPAALGLDRRRESVRPGPPTPAGRRWARGSEWYRNRSFRGWPPSDASSSIAPGQSVCRGPRRSSARACPAGRHTNPACRPRSRGCRRARDCWRVPTRSCSRHSPSANCDAKAACRRSRTRPDRRCRSERRPIRRPSRARGWHNCATRGTTVASAARHSSLAAPCSAWRQRQPGGSTRSGRFPVLIFNSRSFWLSTWVVRKMESPQTTGVLSPHSGNGHRQTTPEVVGPRHGQVGLAARAVVVRPSPLRPVLGRCGRHNARQRRTPMQDQQRTANARRGESWLPSGGGFARGKCYRGDIFHAASAPIRRGKGYLLNFTASGIGVNPLPCLRAYCILNGRLLRGLFVKPRPVVAPLPDERREIRAMDTDLGPRLQMLRKRCGTSIRQLARRAGVAPGIISCIERGKNSPSISTLQKILARWARTWPLSSAAGREATAARCSSASTCGPLATAIAPTRSCSANTLA